ncbi:UDP-glucuronosyl/UDP-glucosyltransferase [Trema orientale]|uniref:UDP-glucuronosyl/UDP-glucosyltransferase n=1 Tax=Trema orientale TaxID=63057 RepID=A0A2P5FVN7_TREOI|nr:UDP-glucuronosyl/UDP-glucosyltransferase [Trema orientale]
MPMVFCKFSHTSGVRKPKNSQSRLSLAELEPHARIWACDTHNLEVFSKLACNASSLAPRLALFVEFSWFYHFSSFFLHFSTAELQFQLAELGLPEGSESTDTLPSHGYLKNFICAIGLLQQPLEQLFQELRPTPTCIVADKNIVWAAETAQKFRVPRIIFDGLGCFVVSCIHHLHVSKIHESVGSESEPFVVPGLPDWVELTRSQLSGAFNPRSDQFLKATRQRVMETEGGAHGVLVNSFEEFEGEYVKEYKKIKCEGKVWCVGPVSLCNKDDLDKAQRGNDNSKASNDNIDCLKWLDSQTQSSVVYACLGSLNSLIPTQMAELGLGLEASKSPFLWVIRGAYKGEEFEHWLREDGLEERTKGRGLFIRGWAPQVLILAHPAVGAFLTHYGWNSTLEGVSAGMPMVTWPIFAEQFYNEKFIVQVKKIGVRVGAEVAVQPGEEEKFRVLVKRGQVREAIDKVLDKGKEGEERIERAKKLAKAAKEAVEKGGSSYLNISLLLEDLSTQLMHA